VPTGGQPPERLAFRGQSRLQIIWEKGVEFSLLCCGVLSIFITLTIAGVLVKGSVEFFQDKEYYERAAAGQPPDRPPVTIAYFLTGTEWSAGFRAAKYGVLPLVTATLMIAAIAALIAVPIGLSTAIYLSEYANPKVRNIAKPVLELLAGIPTVVYGFFAVNTVTPMLAGHLPFFGDIGFQLIPGIQEPYNQLSGGIVVGIMIIPIVASLSEDAMRSVPRALRDGSYALGANRFETSVRVVLPAALSGVLASFILAISRAIGETMAVSLACGDRNAFSLDPREGVATMTAFIVRIAKGDVIHGSTDFNSLFAVGLMLFLMTLAMNVGAEWIRGRYRQVYQ